MAKAAPSDKVTAKNSTKPPKGKKAAENLAAHDLGLVSAGDRSLEGALRWRCIGPVRGGRVVTVAGSYEDRNTFYFGGAGGGVWKTTDGGTYWRPVSDGFFGTSAVGAIEVAPADSNVIYAGTGETTIRIDVSHGDGVYKSTDAGRTWRNVGLRDTRFVGKIRTHPKDADTVWVAALGHAFGPNAERGVFKSDDGGESWRNVLFVDEKTGAVDLSVDWTNPRILYAAAWEAYRSFSMISSGGPGSGIWQSVDGGETWTNITANRGLPKGTLGKIAVAASPAKAGRVWALVEHTTEGGLYRSDDHGATWEKTCDNQNLMSRAWYYTHLTADPQDGDTVYVNNLDFYKSTDGGRTFTTIATPHGDNHDLWIDPADNQRMIQGNDGGANVSYNGGVTFSTIYNQPTAQFYHLATDDRDPYTVYGTQQDNSSIAVPSRVNKAAITWTDCHVAGTGESGYIAVKPDDQDVVFVGAIGSSPGGGNALQRYDRRTDQIRLVTTWPEDNRGRGAEDHKYRFAWTYPILFSPHDPNRLYIGGNLVFTSTDEGQSWQPISPDLTRADPETLKPSGGPVNRDAVGAEIYATVFSLVESTFEQGTLWAGSDDGRLHITRDGGGSWTEITPKGFPEWMLISGIELSPHDAATAYVAGTRYKLDDFAPYLYVTRDYGQTFELITDGIPEDDFTRVIRCDPEVPGLLYAGTETGVYVSYDDGANWQRFQHNLPVSPVHELLIKGRDLICGTHGRSIWILDDLHLVREVAKAGAPEGVKLVAAPETTRILPGIDWSDNTPGSVNYLGGMGGGYLTETTPDGEAVRIWLDGGENPPRGVVVAYHLPEAPAEPISLTFAGANGELRTFTSRTEDDPPIAKERRAPAQAGWNRFVWDMRLTPATKIEGDDPPAKEAVPGPIVAPGGYEVTLTVGGERVTDYFVISPPATVTASPEDLAAQFDLLSRIHVKTDETAKAINRMRRLRGQLDAWATRAGAPASTSPNGANGAGSISDDPAVRPLTASGGEGAGESVVPAETVSAPVAAADRVDPSLNGAAPAIAAAATALRDKVREVEEELLVPELRDGWADTMNRGSRLWHKLTALPPVPAMGDYRPTDSAEAAFADFSGRIDAVLARFDALVESDVAAFNRQVAEAGVLAVGV